MGRSSRAGFAQIWRRSRTSTRPCDRRAALIAHLWARSHPRRPIDPANRGLLRSPTTDGGRCRRAAIGARIDQVVVAVGAVRLPDPATSRVSGDHLARFGRLARTEVLTLDVGRNIPATRTKRHTPVRLYACTPVRLYACTPGKAYLAVGNCGVTSWGDGGLVRRT